MVEGFVFDPWLTTLSDKLRENASYVYNTYA
jgi:hypothetical protein